MTDNSTADAILAGFAMTFLGMGTIMLYQTGNAKDAPVELLAVLFQFTGLLVIAIILIAELKGLLER